MKIKERFLRYIISILAKRNMISEPIKVNLPNLELIGYSITTSIKNNQKQKDIPPFYHEIYDNDKLARFCNGGKINNMYCVFNFHENKVDFDYYVVVEKKLFVKGEQYAKIVLPSSNYIRVEIFKRNHKAVSFIIMFLRMFWIKEQGYTEKEAPSFILYDDRFHANYKKHGCRENKYLGSPVAVLHIPIN